MIIDDELTYMSGHNARGEKHFIKGMQLSHLVWSVHPQHFSTTTSPQLPICASTNTHQQLDSSSLQPNEARSRVCELVESTGNNGMLVLQNETHCAKKVILSARAHAPKLSLCDPSRMVLATSSQLQMSGLPTQQRKKVQCCRIRRKAPSIEGKRQAYGYAVLPTKLLAS